MDFLPVCLDLRARDCLIAGGNAVAARKAHLLLRVQARVTVVAPHLCPALQALHSHGQLRHLRPPPARELLAAQDLVIVADPDPDNGLPLAEQARQMRIPVNVVDHPALCSFIMPSLIDRSPVVIAITSGGTAPVLIRQLRSRIEQLLPEELGQLAEFAGRVREQVRQILPDAVSRRHFWEHWLRSPLARQIMTHPHRDPAHATIQFSAKAQQSRVTNSLQLLSRVPDIPDLMTLRAIRLLAEADVVVHDPHTPHIILDYARRDAEYLNADAMLSADDIAARVARGLFVVWLSSKTLAVEQAVYSRRGIHCVHHEVTAAG